MLFFKVIDSFCNCHVKCRACAVKADRRVKPNIGKDGRLGQLLDIVEAPDAVWLTEARNAATSMVMS